MPEGHGSFLPSASCHPFRVSGFNSVESGGVASLNHRLMAIIPPDSIYLILSGDGIKPRSPENGTRGDPSRAGGSNGGRRPVGGGIFIASVGQRGTPAPSRRHLPGRSRACGAQNHHAVPCYNDHAPTARAGLLQRFPCDAPVNCQPSTFPSRPRREVRLRPYHLRPRPHLPNSGNIYNSLCSCREILHIR